MLRPLRVLLIFWTVNVVAFAQAPRNIELENDVKLFFVGAATQTYLSEYLYIGALYSSDNSYQFNSSHTMAMELRVLSQRLSSRTLSQIWNNAISVNNSAAVLNQNAEQINQFIAILKDKFIDDTPRFIAGDHIRFLYRPNTGTTVSLNGNSLGTITGDTFFPILLHAWIGPVPPSTDFKDGIQGKLNQVSSQKTLFAHYNQLTPSPSRITQIKQALQAAEDARQLEEKRWQETRREAAMAEKERLEQERKEQARLKLEAERLKALEAKRKAEMELAKQEQESISAEEKVKALEQELLRKEYYTKVFNWIRSHQYYPRLALRKGITGTVELLVKTDRKGKILSHSKESSSGSMLLDNAAINTLEKADPVPAMPSGIKDDIFEFRLPLVYSIAEGG